MFVEERTKFAALSNSAMMFLMFLNQVCLAFLVGLSDIFRRFLK